MIKCKYLLALTVLASSLANKALFAQERKAEIVLFKQDEDSAKMIKQWTPLMNEIGKRTGKSVFIYVNTEMEPLKQAISKGNVDVFIDTLYPLLSVDPDDKVQPTLNYWKAGMEEIEGCLVIKDTSSISSIKDLAGKKIVFEDPFSTSGYALPMSIMLHSMNGSQFELIDHKKLVKEGKAPSSPKAIREAKIDSNKIGYLFSGSSETSMQWLESGTVDALGVPCPDIKSAKGIKELARSVKLPRAIVAFHKNMSKDLKEKIVAFMTGLPEDSEILKTGGKAKKVELLKPAHVKSLKDMHTIFDNLIKFPIPK